ncbi:hypothetical protein AGMMS4957_06250 [Bacteroidia bacterium]|nr:hypothetical protein AGMMS4957_06250 [Bacteroidia bacterium]
MDIVACFTTSQTRALKNAKGEVVSYIFEIGDEIGLKPDGSPFSFPQPTVISFDYCFQNKSQEELINGFESPAIICILHQQEYLNLIYAMYKSKATPQKYKAIFEKILEEQCS